MKKEEITELRGEMSDWYLIAQKMVESLDKNQLNYLNSKIISLKRKTSKNLANSVCVDIAELLEMGNPFEYCVDWKWEGFFGLKYVLDSTIYKLKY